MFGETLRRIRRKRGWSAERLARAIGVSCGWLCKVERGELPPLSPARIQLACTEMGSPGKVAQLRTLALASHLERVGYVVGLTDRPAIAAAVERLMLREEF